MRATVYQMNFPNGGTYVGVTSRPLSVRLSEHRSKYLWNEKPESIEPVLTGPYSHRFKMESAIIKALAPTMNKSKGGAGPNGATRPAYCVEIAREQGKARMNDAKWLAKFRAVTQNSEAQSAKGKLGAAARHAKAPLYRFYKRDEFLGIVRYGKDVAAILGTCDINGNKYFQGKLGKRYGYRLEKVEG